LVVDQRIDNTKKNRGVRPLPNLETNFVSANTLLGIERPAQIVFEDPDIQRIEKELKIVRERRFYARSRATKRKCEEEDERLRREMSEVLMRDRWNTAVARKLARWDPYDQNASADFFDPEWMFGNQSGFDITIGNPPYVRADAGGRHLEMRRSIEASEQYETLWEKWDLFIPFIEKGFKLLKPGGITTMIVSDAYCHSKYAKKSQNWFLQNSRILRLDFFSKIKIFDATVRNVTYFFQKADGNHNHPLRRVHDLEFGNVHLLPADEQSKLTYRAFFPEDTQVQTFSTLTIPLENICYTSRGFR
jgi:adenine-specific DNA-methyltransferase